MMHEVQGDEAQRQSRVRGMGGGGLGAGGRNARSGAEDHILTPVGQTSGVLLD